MAYTVLARRYRSQTFEDVAGQDAAAQTLQNAIKAGRVAHAYLFCGTRGVGKTTMARILAKSLNCLSAKEPTVTPCLQCDSCKAINTGEDIDVIEIDGASNNGVDQIRQLRENAAYRPARARYKIYIIDEVHMLTTGAFNALLKILEEPPAHIKFIFATTEPNKVLPTIQSRCQRFDFSSMTPAVIAKQLKLVLQEEKIQAEQEFIDELAILANGSMRDGLSLLDQAISAGQQPLTAAVLETMLGRPEQETLFTLVSAIGSSQPTQVLEAIDLLLSQGHSAVSICDSLVEMFRDIMVLKIAGEKSDLFLLSGMRKNKLLQLAALFAAPWLIYGITAMEKLRWAIRNSETARALLEALLVRLAMGDHFMRLEELASGAAAAVASPSLAADLKKKPLTAPDNSPPAQSSPPPMLFADAGQTDLKGILSQWNRVVELTAQQAPTLSNYLNLAEPSVVSDNCLRLRFTETGQGRFAIDMCRRKQDAIAGVLRELLGRPVEIRYELAQACEQPAAAPTPPAAATGRITRQEHEEIVKDKGVQMVMQGLSARIVQIERTADEIPDDIEKQPQPEMDDNPSDV